MIKRLTLSGSTLDELRGHCLYWYVTPLCFLALELEPAARSIYFAVARFHDADAQPPHDWLAHRFVLSTDESPRWPHAMCRSSNPLLDGRSDAAVRAAHEQLYGAPEVDLGARDGALLAWSAYCKPDRRPTEPLPTTFAPVFSMARREQLANEYIRGPFAVTAQLCATVWQPELLHGHLAPARASAPTIHPPAGMGADELARIAANIRTLSPAASWESALDRDAERLLQLAERLARGPLSEEDARWLRGPQIDALLRAASVMLSET